MRGKYLYMKKQSTAKIILVYFFKTIGIMTLLVGVGVLSYYLTMLYLKQTDRVERSTTYQHVISVNAGPESSNLIYGYDENDGHITGMILELFDQDSKNISYVTIPAETQIEITPTTYQELLKASPSIPQVVDLYKVPGYFTGDVAYEYGIMALQDAFPVEIGYFTAVPSQKFSLYYEMGAKKENIYNPTDAYLSGMKKCTTKADMDDMLKDLCDEQISDITLSQKLNYSEALSKVVWDNYRIYRLKGTDEEGVFIINSVKSRKLVNKIWESVTYTTPQFEPDGSEVEEVVEEQNIEILNGSAIDGLASSYQKTMQDDGLSVINIGNYTGMKQETTTIYARNVKWAKKNLRKYFPHPKKVEVIGSTTLEEGVDVQIILGVDADA